MRQRRGQMHDFFGFKDPFAESGLFGRPGSLISSFFGGSDPFDDPFFTSPFESLMDSSLFAPMGPSTGTPFTGASNAGFIEQRDPNPVRKSSGPIIKELSSDEEGEEKEKVEGEKKDKSAKYLKNGKEPLVEGPDEETEVKRKKRVKNGNELNRAGTSQNRPFSCTFQSSTVTYGGHNGAYYTSSTTRRTGSGGITLEESKEADTTTGKATHRISRGIGNKGHSITRQLGSAGRVDTMQMLHNLNEDELAGFEEQWNKNGRKHLPEIKPVLEILENGKMRDYQRERPRRGWALLSTERVAKSSSLKHNGTSGAQHN